MPNLWVSVVSMLINLFIAEFVFQGFYKLQKEWLISKYNRQLFRVFSV